MNKNTVSIAVFVIVLFVAAYAVFTLFNKPSPYSSTPSQYSLSSDLEELNSADLNLIDSNLNQLDSESSTI